MKYVSGRGFYCGYAQIGLDMLQVAINDPRVIQAVARRKTNQDRFNRKYYLENKDRIRKLKREWRIRRGAGHD